MDTKVEDVRYDFEVNTVGTVKLFKSTWPLLRDGDAKKFIVVSSSVGSIAALEQESFPGTAYGISKAALNWFAKKVSVEMKGEGLLVGIVHPG